jgi:hypothetical protein
MNPPNYFNGMEIDSIQNLNSQTLNDFSQNRNQGASHLNIFVNKMI